MAGVPRYHYPAGWIGKPMSRRMRIALLVMLGVAAALVLLTVAMGSW